MHASARLFVLSLAVLSPSVACTTSPAPVVDEVEPAPPEPTVSCAGMPEELLDPRAIRRRRDRCANGVASFECEVVGDHGHQRVRALFVGNTASVGLATDPPAGSSRL